MCQWGEERLCQGVSGHCLSLQVNLSNASRTQGGNSFDDSTLPLIDRNQKTGTCFPFSVCPHCPSTLWVPRAAGLCPLPALQPWLSWQPQLLTQSRQFGL